MNVFGLSEPISTEADVAIALLQDHEARFDHRLIDENSLYATAFQPGDNLPTTWFKPNNDGSEAVVFHIGVNDTTDVPLFTLISSGVDDETRLHSNLWQFKVPVSRESSTGRKESLFFYSNPNSGSRISLYGNDTDNGEKVRIATQGSNWIPGLEVRGPFNVTGASTFNQGINIAGDVLANNIDGRTINLNGPTVDVKFLLNSVPSGDVFQEIEFEFNNHETAGTRFQLQRRSDTLWRGTLAQYIDDSGWYFYTAANRNADETLVALHLTQKRNAVFHGGVSAINLSAQGTGFISWENGINRITSNDGGGNVQMRFGHDYSDGAERFTHDGTAFYVGGSLDSPNGALQIGVAANGGAGNDQVVTWGHRLFITEDNITWADHRILTTADSPSFATADQGALAQSAYQPGTTLNSNLNIVKPDLAKLTLEGTGSSDWAGSNLVLHAGDCQPGDRFTQMNMYVHRRQDGTCSFSMRRESKEFNYAGEFLVYSDEQGLLFKVASDRQATGMDSSLSLYPNRLVQVHSDLYVGDKATIEGEAVFNGEINAANSTSLCVAMLGYEVIPSPSKPTIRRHVVNGSSALQDGDRWEETTTGIVWKWDDTNSRWQDAHEQYWPIPEASITSAEWLQGDYLDPTYIYTYHRVEVSARWSAPQDDTNNWSISLLFYSDDDPDDTSGVHPIGTTADLNPDPVSQKYALLKFSLNPAIEKDPIIDGAAQYTLRIHPEGTSPGGIVRLSARIYYRRIHR